MGSGLAHTRAGPACQGARLVRRGRVALVWRKIRTQRMLPCALLRSCPGWLSFSSWRSARLPEPLSRRMKAPQLLIPSGSRNAFARAGAIRRNAGPNSVQNSWPMVAARVPIRRRRSAISTAPGTRATAAPPVSSPGGPMLMPRSTRSGLKPVKTWQSRRWRSTANGARRATCWSTANRRRKCRAAPRAIATNYWRAAISSASSHPAQRHGPLPPPLQAGRTAARKHRVSAVLPEETGRSAPGCAARWCYAPPRMRPARSCAVLATAGTSDWTPEYRSPANRRSASTASAPSPPPGWRVPRNVSRNWTAGADSASTGEDSEPSKQPASPSLPPCG
jgi:hypothetical protein